MFNNLDLFSKKSKVRLVSGNSNIPFAKQVASYLGTELLRATVGRFSDGEINVQIEDNVRGEDIFIIQSLSNPTNDNLMELLIMVDALKRSSVNSIHAVIPYFGYARQDRKAASRVPITAKLVASMLELAGIDRVITIDLHAAQIQGFFDIPVDNLYGALIFEEFFKQRDLSNAIITSPDVGGVARSRYFAKLLNLDLAIIDKRREVANQAEVMNIIGDVNGKDIILLDDMIDTAGTIVKGAAALKERGAKKVMACCTHPVLSGNAFTNLENSDLDELIVSDTIPLKKELPIITVVSATELFAKVIVNIVDNDSISSLFEA